MSNRFTNNVTPLDAVTLNQFEDDLKQYANLPVFNVIYSGGNGSFYEYEISDPTFIESLKIGYTFVILPDVSSQGTSNKIIALKIITSPNSSHTDPLHWSDSSTPVVGSGYARVNNDKYLVAGRPYIIKCFTKVQNNWQFIIVSNEVGTIPVTEKGAANGVAPLGSDSKVPLANLPTTGTSSTFGVVKVWMSGTTLNISTT